jgi:hypothetical protein
MLGHYSLPQLQGGGRLRISKGCVRISGAKKLREDHDRKTGRTKISRPNGTCEDLAYLWHPQKISPSREAIPRSQGANRPVCTCNALTSISHMSTTHTKISYTNLGLPRALFGLQRNSSAKGVWSRSQRAKEACSMSLTPEVSEEELFSADEEDEGEGFEDPYSAFEARAAAANMAAQSSHGSVDEGIGGSDSSQPRGTHAFDEEDCDFSPRKAPKKRRASTSSNSTRTPPHPSSRGDRGSGTPSIDSTTTLTRRHTFADLSPKRCVVSLPNLEVTPPATCTRSVCLLSSSSLP